MKPSRQPELARALRPVRRFGRADRAISRMFSEDLADVGAMVESGLDRDLLRADVERAIPDHLQILERLFQNVDRKR